MTAIDTQETQMLQAIEQQLHHMTVNKQSMQSKIVEIDSAIKALTETKISYKAIANVLVAKKPSELSQELQDEKKAVEVRIGNYDVQIQTLQDKKKELQQKIMDKVHENE